MEIFSYHEGLGKWIEIANVRDLVPFMANRKKDIVTDFTVRYFPSRDVGTYGNTKECKGIRMGNEL
jgi:hypothetical protein